MMNRNGLSLKMALGWWGRAPVPRDNWNGITIGISDYIQHGETKVTVCEPFSPVSATMQPHRVIIVAMSQHGDTPDRVVGITRRTVVTVSQSGVPQQIDVDDGSISKDPPEAPPISISQVRSGAWTIANLSTVLARLCRICADGPDSASPCSPRGAVTEFDSCDPAVLCDAVADLCSEREIGPASDIATYAVIGGAGSISDARAAVGLVASAVASAGNARASAREAVEFAATGASTVGFGVSVAEAYFCAGAASDGRPTEAYRASDGSRVDCSRTAEARAVLATAIESAHRNRRTPWIVLAVRPAAVAVAGRCAYGCQTCGPSAGTCRMSLPRVHGGLAYITSDDVPAVATGAAIRRFDLAVSRMSGVAWACSLAEPECACQLVVPRHGERNCQSRSCPYSPRCSLPPAGGADHCSSGSAGGASAKDSSRDALAAELGEPAVHAIGPEGAVVRDVVSMCASVLVTRMTPMQPVAPAQPAFATVGGDGTISISEDCGAMPGGNPHAGVASMMSDASADWCRRALHAAKWDVRGIRRVVPPCLATVVDQCTESRHPKYHERLVLLSLLSSIFGGGKAVAPGMSETWESLFNHFEHGYSELTREEFLKSKYGTASLEDAHRMHVRGVSFGCAALSTYGMCPYAKCEDAASASAVALECDKKCGRVIDAGTYEDANSKVPPAPHGLPLYCAQRWCTVHLSAITGVVYFVTRPGIFFDKVCASSSVALKVT